MTDTKLASFDDVQAGMIFTTVSWWGMDGASFKVVEVGPGYAFITMINPDCRRWPSGMSRKLDFSKATFSDFTFYA